MTRLVVRGLRAGFGSQDVLRGLDLEVSAGTTLTLVGPNGAGKSTLLAALTGLHPVRAGTARLEGADPIDLGATPAARLLARGVARTFQHAGLAPDLDVRANVRLGLPPARRGGWRARASDGVTPLLEALDLRDVRDATARELPTAARQRVALARALVSRPRLLLLDEPGAGLDEATKARMRDVLQSFLPSDGIVLLVEHDRAWARSLADEVRALDEGRIAAESPTPSLEAAPDLDPPRDGEPRLVTDGLRLAPGAAAGRRADPCGEASRWLSRLAEDAPLALDGRALDRLSGVERARAGLYRLPERGAAPPDLTVQEDLQLTASLTRADAARLVADDPLLRGRARQRIGTLSGGERRWSGLLGALARRPRVLLLDEPTAGLAPAMRAEAWRRLHALRQAGTVLVFVSADPQEIAAHAHVDVSPD